MNPYEITFIVRPDLDEEATRDTVDVVRRRIDTAGGQILSAFPWGAGRRRMAYPIRDFNDGYYYTIDFNLDAQAVRDLEVALRLNDALLRFLVVSATEQMLKNAQQREHQQSQMAAQAAVQAAAGPQPAAPQPVSPSPVPALAEVQPQVAPSAGEPAPFDTPVDIAVEPPTGSIAAVEEPLPVVVVAEPDTETELEPEAATTGANPASAIEGE